MKKLIENKGWLPIFKGWFGNDEFVHNRIVSELEFYDIDVSKTDIYQKSYHKIYDKYIDEANINIFEAVKQELLNLNLATDIVYENMVIPNEYNYRNDSINCTYFLSQENIFFLIDNIKNYYNELKATIENDFTSCSGFISYHSNDITNNSWSIDNIINDTYKLSYIFEFILVNKGLANLIENSLYEVDIDFNLLKKLVNEIKNYEKKQVKKEAKDLLNIESILKLQVD